MREIIASGGGRLSIFMVGHPRLVNDLKCSSREATGDRTSKCDFVALGEERRAFLDWSLT